MYRFYLNKVNNDYHYCELIRVFMNDSEFEAYGINWPFDFDTPLSDKSFIINKDSLDDSDLIKRELYNLLVELTGIHPEWGTITGVRPLKIAYDIFEQLHSFNDCREVLKSKYLISDKKLDILMDTLRYQVLHVPRRSDSVSIYIGIPFCPTRCSYCSFASNIADTDEIDKYLSNLLKEIEYMGELLRQNNTDIESIYIGGGTPTTLNSFQLDQLIICIEDKLHIKPKDIEFTIEAGRPDTIDESKLDVLKRHNVSRISINPQTMKDDTLRLIGREHNAAGIVAAYELAHQYGFQTINADLIAGLPGETVDDFRQSLIEVIKLGANNITIHTLSVKRGSRLESEDPQYYRHNRETVAEMLELAGELLDQNGFYSYYIYKQKHQIGSYENVGYCLEGAHSLYNIRIMEEKQTIIGLGAGAIGKVYYPDENRLERIPNVSNYLVYNEHFDEMLARKNLYFGGKDGN